MNNVHRWCSFLLKNQEKINHQTPARDSKVHLISQYFTFQYSHCSILHPKIGCTSGGMIEMWQKRIEQSPCSWMNKVLLTGACSEAGIIEEGSCIPTILQAPSSNPDPVVLLAFCCMHSFHSPGHLKLPLSSPDGSLPHASITKIGQTNLISIPYWFFTRKNNIEGL